MIRYHTRRCQAIFANLCRFLIAHAVEHPLLSRINFERATLAPLLSLDAHNCHSPSRRNSLQAIEDIGFTIKEITQLYRDY